jgi:hypothetical protein
LWTICPEWLQTMILLTSTSWVAGITGMGHRCPACLLFFKSGAWYVAQAGLKSFCLSLLSAGIADRHHHTWLPLNFWWTFLFLQKTCHWDFDRDHMESVDHFWQYWNLSNSNSSILWPLNVVAKVFVAGTKYLKEQVSEWPKVILSDDCMVLSFILLMWNIILIDSHVFNLFFFLSGTQLWTQGFMLAKQMLTKHALYCLRHFSSLNHSFILGINSSWSCCIILFYMLLNLAC